MTRINTRNTLSVFLYGVYYLTLFNISVLRKSLINVPLKDRSKGPELQCWMCGHFETWLLAFRRRSNPSLWITSSNLWSLLQRNSSFPGQGAAGVLWDPNLPGPARTEWLEQKKTTDQNICYLTNVEAAKYLLTLRLRMASTKGRCGRRPAADIGTRRCTLTTEPKSL